jgi:hypothetical protein
MPIIKKPSEHFDVATWTGTGGGSGATRSITGLNFQPDFVWEKARSSGSGHQLLDSVRGVGQNKVLASNSTGAEPNPANTESLYGWLSSLDSGGFTVTNGTSTFDNWNKSGDTYVGWTWKAGGTAVTNTSGSITSQVSVNTTAGFSIVSYASGSAGQKTVGHGLGVTPSMIITKSRDNNSYNWSIYHSSVIDNTSKFLRFTTDAIVTSSTIWGAALPTSTVFGITSDNGVPANNNCIAYCWAPVAGYSAFGSYASNNSTDGPFIYTGFRPKFIMIKITSGGTGNWEIFDTSRNTFNRMDLLLLPSDASTESNSYGSYYIDAVSNGFKIRGNGAGFNGSGETLIYAAFAEAPFKYANAR